MRGRASLVPPLLFLSLPFSPHEKKNFASLVLFFSPLFSSLSFFSPLPSSGLKALASRGPLMELPPPPGFLSSIRAVSWFVWIRGLGRGRTRSIDSLGVPSFLCFPDLLREIPGPSLAPSPLSPLPLTFKVQTKIFYYKK